MGDTDTVLHTHWHWICSYRGKCSMNILLLLLLLLLPRQDGGGGKSCVVEILGVVSIAIPQATNYDHLLM